MDAKGVIDAATGMRGVTGMRILDRTTVSRLQSIESREKTFAGMPMECPGMDTCASKQSVFVMFCDSGFPEPTESMIEMVDDRGVTIGHDVPGCQRDRYDDGSVFWMCSNMVVYPEKMNGNGITVRLYAIPMTVGDVNGSLYYPSKESADMLNGMFGMEGRALSTLILGVDGLETSVPVTDVVEVAGGGCRHGEPASEDALD